LGVSVIGLVTFRSTGLVCWANDVYEAVLSNASKTQKRTSVGTILELKGKDKK